jgi:hypothetical protein
MGLDWKISLGLITVAFAILVIVMELLHARNAVARLDRMLVKTLHNTFEIKSGQDILSHELRGRAFHMTTKGEK